MAANKSPLYARPATKEDIREAAKKKGAKSEQDLHDLLADFNIIAKEGGADRELYEEFKKVAETAGRDSPEYDEAYSKLLESSHVPGTEITTDKERERLKAIKKTYADAGYDIPDEVLDQGLGKVRERASLLDEARAIVASSRKAKPRQSTRDYSSMDMSQQLTPKHNSYRASNLAGSSAYQAPNYTQQKSYIQQQSYQTPQGGYDNSQFQNTKTKYVDQYGQDTGYETTAYGGQGDGYKAVYGSGAKNTGKNYGGYIQQGNMQHQASGNTIIESGNMRHDSKGNYWIKNAQGQWVKQN